MQASSEHPLGKAIVAYARHFNFFDDSATSDAQDSTSAWLYDVADFSAIPGRGIRCFINGKLILVTLLFYSVQ